MILEIRPTIFLISENPRIVKSPNNKKKKFEKFFEKNNKCFKIGRPYHFKNGKVCPPANSEARARRQLEQYSRHTFLITSIVRF
jgi:hypothetical protein